MHRARRSSYLKHEIRAVESALQLRGVAEQDIAPPDVSVANDTELVTRLHQLQVKFFILVKSFQKKRSKLQELIVLLENVL